MTSADYAPLELQAVLLARELKDGEIGSSGMASQLPMAAMLLARELHAPNLIIGGERPYNPKPRQLYEDDNDPRRLEGSEGFEGFWELFGHWHKGDMDFFFYSGMQIDAYGNCNNHFIGGTYEKPKVRGPGIPNISIIQICKRVYLYPTAHTPRTFVEKVDFISAPGNLQGPESKRAAGLTKQGPALCVTPLAVMDFDPETLRMRLKSVHPGVTAEQVQERTGFKLGIPAKVPVTQPPTDHEMAVLRNIVDPLGLLRRKH